ncbi:hypothetical protein [Nocardioides sp. B-3]|uniref:hypothetical protein n=1 Tax=Nocardioides sp. B-3 TaxID=2895565 RepID=UPI0021535F4F|nr:hypothetical protein [Nocardioides sp. B-3]UUZ59778.1 hypothetical protein LP418_01320 [Nocardioides sp. B-3]
MLLLFVTFLFINTEVWMVASAPDGGTLWGATLLFAAMALGFPVVRPVEEVDRLDDEVGREELGDDADVVGLQRTNLVLVLLITRAFQCCCWRWPSSPSSSSSVRWRWMRRCWRPGSRDP